jgi:hypothetical protein
MQLGVRRAGGAVLWGGSVRAPRAPGALRGARVAPAVTRPPTRPRRSRRGPRRGGCRAAPQLRRVECETRRPRPWRSPPPLHHPGRAAGAGLVASRARAVPGTARQPRRGQPRVRGAALPGGPLPATALAADRRVGSKCPALASGAAVRNHPPRRPPPRPRAPVQAVLCNLASAAASWGAGPRGAAVGALGGGGR